MPRPVLLAAVVTAALFAGCSTSASSPNAASPNAVTVHVTDQLRFVPSTIRVHVGTVRITLVDDGSYPHDLSVPALRATSRSVTGNPGEQRTVLTLRFAAQGTYRFQCTYHASAGMVGRIVVAG